jgi:hypothetical protein
MFVKFAPHNTRQTTELTRIMDSTNMSYYITTTGEHLVTDALIAFGKWKELNEIDV